MTPEMHFLQPGCVSSTSCGAQHSFAVQISLSLRTSRSVTSGSNYLFLQITGDACGMSGVSTGSCAGDGAGGTWTGAGGSRRCGQKGWQPLSDVTGKEGTLPLCPVAPACARLSLAHCLEQEMS